jgi:site-specific recombinase XerD
MATVTFFLDTRKTEVGTGIIKLRVTHKNVQRDYSTKLKVEKKLFDKLKKSGDTLDGRIKESLVVELHNFMFGKKDDLTIFKDGYIVKARKVIIELGDNFSFDVFKDKYENYGIENEFRLENDIVNALNLKGQELKDNGQISHSGSYSLAAKSLIRFVNQTKKNKTAISFNEITPSFLNQWSNYMRKFGKASKKLKNGIPLYYEEATDTTIAIYSRAIRSICLEAIEKGIISRESYPFGAKRFSIPESANKKKALSDEQLELIKNYKPEPMSLKERSHDFWMFSYFGNGMNFSDILNLKWKDLSDEGFSFIRQKTKRKPVIINVKVNKFMAEVIERQGNSLKGKNNYIFPFLEGTEDIARKKAIINQVIKVTNQYMNQIGAELGITEKINSYEARHSFATKMMRMDAPLKMIQEKLGHKKLSTTEQYLGSFGKDVENDYLDKL